MVQTQNATQEKVDKFDYRNIANFYLFQKQTSNAFVTSLTNKQEHL